MPIRRRDSPNSSFFAAGPLSTSLCELDAFHLRVNFPVISSNFQIVPLGFLCVARGGSMVGTVHGKTN